MKIRLRTLIYLGLAGLLGATAFVLGGVYNIAAVDQHTRPVYNVLELAMRQSVKVRAASTEVPNLTETERIQSGFQGYRAHCLQCHGAPGVAPALFAYGMTPAPANLTDTIHEWTPEQIFWVVKFGIKMSGMPAWQYQLSDNEIWDIVAFVQAFRHLSPAEYAVLSAALPEESPHGHEHGQAETLTRPILEGNLGDAQAGREAIGQFLCATCHRIPGIVGANRNTGPPLQGIGTRKFIAGIIPNTAANMVAYLQNPQRFDPLSAMPNLLIPEKHARDIAAYLYTLRDPDE